jgi:DNA-binding transcriptional regulator LsrR (DeoR family)
VCELAKLHNFLGFTFQNIDNEVNHLKSTNEANEEVKAEIIKLQTENAGITQTAIAEKLGINKMKVSRVMKEINENKS